MLKLVTALLSLQSSKILTLILRTLKSALKALSKAQAEIQLWRSRFETEGLGRVDELESSRSKLQARIQEAEENVETLNVKIANGEKSRARMQTDLEELSL